MTFKELDQRIRASVPDVVERKKILTGLHEIEEAINQCASFYLSAAGYTVAEDGIYKEGSSTRFQVNE